MIKAITVESSNKNYSKINSILKIKGYNSLNLAHKYLADKAASLNGDDIRSLSLNKLEYNEYCCFFTEDEDEKFYTLEVITDFSLLKGKGYSNDESSAVSKFLIESIYKGEVI